VITFGSWNHVAVTHDASTSPPTTTLYANGVQVAQATIVTLTGETTTVQAGFYAFYAKADLDEIAIYWTALSAARITAHWDKRNETVGTQLYAHRPGTWANTIAISETAANINPTSATLTGGTNGWSGTVSTGLQTIDIAGDRWRPDSTTALSALEEVVNTERGMLWVTQTGGIEYREWSYLGFLGSDTIFWSDLPFEGDNLHVGLDAASSVANIVNRVQANYTPRRTLSSGVVARANNVLTVPGQSGTERWNGVVKFPGGGEVVVKLPYTDPGTGQFVGAKNLTVPLVAGTDYTVWENSDGTGFDYTYAGVVTASVNINGADVEVSLKNTALGPVYVKDLQVRGTGIVGYEPQQIIREDATSQAAYGTRTLSVDLPLATSLRWAESVAAAELVASKDPEYRANAITYNNPTLAWSNNNIMWFPVGHAMYLTDFQAGITDALHMITGRQMRLAADKSFSLTWSLRATDRYPYTIWNYDNWDECQWTM
jgi:hypothetical protein